MKIALFGGSFDPVHRGHERVLEELLKRKDIDKIIIMPACLSPFKSKNVASKEQRMSWLAKVFLGSSLLRSSADERVLIDDYEIRQEVPVPSIKSVKYLLEKYSPSTLYLVIGADHLETLHLWDSYEELASLVTFIIANRNGVNIPSSFAQLATYEDISSTNIRQTLDLKGVNAKVKNEVYDVYRRAND